jgi:hypothetical protein
MVDRAAAREVQGKYADHLLDDYNDIIAVDIGYRTKNGEVIEGEVCLVVWVKKKLPKSQLEPDQVLPEEIKGVPLDVVEGEVYFT